MFIHKYVIFVFNYVILFIFVFQFILFGIISILSEKYPSPCLVSGSDVLMLPFIVLSSLHVSLHSDKNNAHHTVLSVCAT